MLISTVCNTVLLQKIRLVLVLTMLMLNGCERTLRGEKMWLSHPPHTWAQMRGCQIKLGSHLMLIKHMTSQKTWHNHWSHWLIKGHLSHGCIYHSTLNRHNVIADPRNWQVGMLLYGTYAALIWMVCSSTNELYSLLHIGHVYHPFISWPVYILTYLCHSACWEKLRMVPDDTTGFYLLCV